MSAGWSSLAACDASVESVIDAARRATASGRAADLVPLLHPDYADPLGDGSDLVRQLDAWFDAHPPRSFEARIAIPPAESSSTRRVAVGVDLSGEWGGEPSFWLAGPVRVTLERWDGYKLRSGWLTRLRDVGRLVEAWERTRRAPSVPAVEALLHPAYADALANERDARDAWLRHGPEPARVTLARLDIRDDLAHLDLHEMVDEGPRSRPEVHRLTLRPVAGRLRIAAGIDFGGPTRRAKTSPPPVKCDSCSPRHE